MVVDDVFPLSIPDAGSITGADRQRWGGVGGR